MPGTLQDFQWPIAGAVVLGAAALLTAVSKIVQVIKRVAAPLREFVAEHDMLWEDYNIRTGGSYRRSTGRGAPPEPEEFYRKQHKAEEDDES